MYNINKIPYNLTLEAYSKGHYYIPGDVILLDDEIVLLCNYINRDGTAIPVTIPDRNLYKIEGLDILENINIGDNISKHLNLKQGDKIIEHPMMLTIEEFTDLKVTEDTIRLLSFEDGEPIRLLVKTEDSDLANTIIDLILLDFEDKGIIKDDCFEDDCFEDDCFEDDCFEDDCEDVEVIEIHLDLGNSTEGDTERDRFLLELCKNLSVNPKDVDVEDLKPKSFKTVLEPLGITCNLEDLSSPSFKSNLIMLKMEEIFRVDRINSMKEEYGFKLDPKSIRSDQNGNVMIKNGWIVNPLGEIKEGFLSKPTYRAWKDVISPITDNLINRKDRRLEDVRIGSLFLSSAGNVGMIVSYHYCREKKRMIYTLLWEDKIARTTIYDFLPNKYIGNYFESPQLFPIKLN